MINWNVSTATRWGLNTLILLGMVLIGVLGLVLDYLMRQFVQLVMPWHKGQ